MVAGGGGVVKPGRTGADVVKVAEVLLEIAMVVVVAVVGEVAGAVLIDEDETEAIAIGGGAEELEEEEGSI